MANVCHDLDSRVVTVNIVKQRHTASIGLGRNVKVSAITAVPKSRCIAIASEDTSGKPVVHVYNVVSGSRKHTLVAGASCGPLTSLSCDSSGELLLAISSTGHVLIWHKTTSRFSKQCSAQCIIKHATWEVPHSPPSCIHDPLTGYPRLNPFLTRRAGGGAALCKHGLDRLHVAGPRSERAWPSVSVGDFHASVWEDWAISVEE